ncbi:acyltransferase [Mucilaginibacter terrae]|uniref:Surface polysaccharide O-acyltransferase-like enzyme n=1 Tax=Mucilaginibacter terrae TaxID=1955052 RepID=A0ABU3GQW9_9SPHI|nr:acyltransferase family protein [Mucilaginibacter terrae]MDT3402182.1 surface polysaccharide O-acyltransferase-like enzyme [Mucilaginibacter terrae]
MKEVNNRSVWADNMRMIATIAVIIVHVATPAVFTQFKPQTNANNIVWWVGNVYGSVFRFCVPVFVMLTGALLLPYQLTLGEFLKKRLNRILLPFLFWTIVYILFNLGLKIRNEGSASTLANILPWIINQLMNGAAPHLWYVYMIVGLYLFIPIVQPFISNATNKTIVFYLVIWLLALLINQLQVTTAFDLRYFTGYLGYLILGYFLAHRVNITLPTLYAAVFLLLSGCMITIAGTYTGTHSKGVFVHRYYEYLTVNVLFTSVGVFVLIKKLLSGNYPALAPFREFISRYGYGIYLSHLLVISLLAHFNINYSLVTPVAGILLTTFICLACSSALVYIINKLPYGKYISG